MKSNQKLSIMFWLFKAKADKKGLAPIYAKLTIEGDDVDISIGRKVNPIFWDEKLKEDLEKSSTASETNFRIKEVKRDLEQHFDLLRLDHTRVTPQMLKNRYNGKAANWTALAEKKEKESKTTLMGVVEVVMSQLDLMVNAGQRTKATRTCWKTSVGHLSEFVKYHTGSNDIDLEQVDRNFVNEFLNYMTLYRSPVLQPVSAEKKIIHLKHFIEFAYDKEWVSVNRIGKFSYNPEPKKVKPLQYNEVLSIYKKEFSNPRLEKIKDIFIFQCFTGFAYTDLLNLTKENLLDHGDSNKWLIRDRTKTESDELVPVLPIIDAIMHKYENHPTVIKKGVLLPVMSNQKYNGYLKEVGDLCNINRGLTTHLARHTFAHLMLNVCYLPLEDVGKMLGHRSPKSTTRYCQVGKERLIHSMNIAKSKLFKEDRLKEKLAS